VAAQLAASQGGLNSMELVNSRAAFVKSHLNTTGFEVFTAVTTKSCRTRRFGRTYCLQKLSKGPAEASRKLSLQPYSYVLQLGLLYDPEDGGDVLPKRRDLTRLHGVTNQKTAPFLYFYQNIFI
jgi:hypothetical protein